MTVLPVDDVSRIQVAAGTASSIPTKNAGPAERDLASRVRLMIAALIGDHYEARVILYRKSVT